MRSKVKVRPYIKGTKGTQNLEFGGEKQAKRKADFLDMLTAGASVLMACDELNIGRTTVYKWKNSDPDFRSGWINARQDYKRKRLEILEDAAFDFATGDRKDGNATMLKHLLASYDPSTYVEKREVVVEERELVWDIPLPQRFLDRLLPEQQTRAQGLFRQKLPQ